MIKNKVFISALLLASTFSADTAQQSQGMPLLVVLGAPIAMLAGAIFISIKNDTISKAKTT